MWDWLNKIEEENHRMLDAIINTNKIMELIYPFVPLNFYNYIKISFILLLFIINIYLMLTYNPVKDNQPILQAGFGNKNIKGWLQNLAMIGGFLSTYIAVKNEIRDIQIGRLDQLQEDEREGIRKSIDKDREEHKNLLDSIIKYREEVNKLHIEKAKIYGHNDRLQILQDSMKEKIASYQNKSINPDTKLSELGIIDQLIKRDTNKFSLEVNSLISNTDLSNIPTTSKIEEESVDNINDLKESSIFYLDIFSFMDWFEGLNGIKKLAISMIFAKSIIFSALTSIIFIFYGNILIKKYDLENRYPKLAFIIQLRQRFQKYYFKLNCLFILIVIITEVIFAIAVLLL